MGNRRWRRVFLVFLPLGTVLGGCAALGLTLLGVGAGVTAGTGVSYTLNNIVYKTFTTNLEEVRQGTGEALKVMGFPVEKMEETPEGMTILAKGANPESQLDIEIELERLSPQSTRMRVVAKRGVFAKDRATATEIILQTAKILDEREGTMTRAARGAVNARPVPGKGGE